MLRGSPLVVRFHWGRNGAICVVLAGHSAERLKAMVRVDRVGCLAEAQVRLPLWMVQSRDALQDRAACIVTIFVLVWVACMHKSEVLGYGNPLHALAECRLVAVETLQTAIILLAAIHRRVLLMSEGDAGAGHAWSLSFNALSAYGAFFAALELEKEVRRWHASREMEMDIPSSVGM